MATCAQCGRESAGSFCGGCGAAVGGTVGDGTQAPAGGQQPVPPWGGAPAAAPPWQQGQSAPPYGGYPPYEPAPPQGHAQQPEFRGDPAGDGAPRAGWLERVYRGRPLHYPSVLGWIASAFGRNPLGSIVAFVVAWFNVVPALLVAAVGAVFGGLAGSFQGVLAGVLAVDDLPYFGELMPNLLANTGGLGGFLLGFALGAVAGFLTVFAGPVLLVYSDDPVRAFWLVVGQLVTGAVVGVAYTVLYNAFEGTVLRMKGARPLSRRENEFVLPIVHETATRLGMRGVPRVLIDDSRGVNAYAGARHVVVNQGLLDEFEYDREVLAGVVAHELTHWNNADAVSSIFVRGVALPIYIPYAALKWAIRGLGPVAGGIFVLLFWWLIWPFVLVMRFMIRPAVTRDTRLAEYRADAGAVAAGHVAGIRRLLVRLRRTMETGLNGWDEAICRTHPPNELRLERLEQPGVSYPLPDPDGPVAAGEAGGRSSSLLRD